MKKKKRQTTAAIAGMFFLAMTLGGCGQTADDGMPEEESAVAVSTKRVETGTITLTNSFIGTVSPQETVMIIPMTAGTVTETFFEAGDTVQAGDVLFKIDDEAAKLQYQNAQLGLENAKQTADSTRKNLVNQQDSTDLQLEGSKIQTQSTFDSAQIGYVMSKDSYEKLDRQYTDLKKVVDAMEALEKAQGAQQPAGGTQDVSSGNPSSDVTSGGETQKEIEALKKELEELKKKIENPQSSLSDMKASLSSLETARDQAYQAYLSARSGYNAAQKSLDLSKDTETVTKDQLAQSVLTTEDQLALSLDMAQLSVAQAQLALDYYTVTTPVSGVVESKNVEVNGIASQSSPAYTIVNNNAMTVTFQVSEDVKNTLSVGQEVTLERNQDTYKASITEIGASVNPQSGLFQIKACAPVTNAELPSGVSVKVSADTYRSENAMIIPYESVYYENEGAYVYVSVNGRAVKKPITTGIFDDDNIVVTGGLELGDIVVTSWSPQLTDGALLRAAE